MPWKFCPDCGSKFDPAHKFCAECGKKRDGADPAPPKDAISELLRAFSDQSGKLPAPKRSPLDWEKPRVIPMISEPCAFDGLPPGVYHLYCGCSKCSPRCATTSTYRLRGDEQISYTGVTQ
jgi:hypothetical protein